MTGRAGARQEGPGPQEGLRLDVLGWASLGHLCPGMGTSGVQSLCIGGLGPKKQEPTGSPAQPPGLQMGH